MNEAQLTLEGIQGKVKPWLVSSTFSTAIEAKRHAARMFIVATGVRVAPFAGGTFSVFSWIKEGISYGRPSSSLE